MSSMEEGQDGPSGHEHSQVKASLKKLISCCLDKSCIIVEVDPAQHQKILI